VNTKKLYERWLLKATEFEDLKAELNNISDNENEINDRFYRELEFGTGGLRGVLGAGTNRMNVYTVRKATQGLANYLLNKYAKPSVAIAYDSRNKSDEFAKQAAGVFAANGIKAYIYQELMPTPALSFAIRELGCSAGIVITASHNPAKYNGYKVYGDDGCQITLEAAELVLEQINGIDAFDGVKTASFDSGLKSGIIEYIQQAVIDKFIACVKAEAINKDFSKNAGLKVVYTPLNGAGNRCVRRILSEIGIADVTVVPEQEKPDGNFPTCPYPNPEIKEALQKGLELCAKVNPDLLLATDPDCDRVGIAVNHGGEFKLLTGNEVGVLLLDYIAKQRIANGTMPQKPIAVKTIVTTTMADAVAKNYGIEIINVLTGFKFIGEQIGMLEQKGEQGRYIFGFEESYGYLSGAYVRDKDAVNASMLICEMAVYYKNMGKTLVDALNELYEKYGIYYNMLSNFAFEGADGMAKMNGIMQKLRENAPDEIAGFKVVLFADYEKSVKTENGKASEINLPKSNVLEFGLDNGATFIVRPSGTEPKLKIYYSLKSDSHQKVAELAKKLEADVKRIIGLN